MTDTKVKISNILKDVSKKGIEFEHKDKLDIFYYSAKQLGKEGKELVLKALNKSKPFNEAEYLAKYDEFLSNRKKFDSVFKNSTFPGFARVLKNYDFDVNSYGLPFDFNYNNKTVGTEISNNPENVNITQKNLTVKDKNSGSKSVFDLVEEFISQKYDIRNNIISKEYECKLKNEADYKPLNENNLFIKIIKAGIKISLNNLIALLKSEFTPIFNPFEDYFHNLPAWDGKDHIKYLCSFIETDDRERFVTHFKKWLVRTVKTALIDDYFNKQAFILIDENQNTGKTTFCRFLCPPKLGNYIKENISFDKDSLISLTSNFLINMDELATLSKVEINQLKSTFSKDRINERLPYDKKSSNIPRRCSFIGSTNHKEFLTDETGSVRWLCFDIKKIDWKYKSKVVIDQVWAQAYSLSLDDKFDHNLTFDELKENEVVNKNYQNITPEREYIIKYFLPGTKDNHTDLLMTTEIENYITAKHQGLRLITRQIGRELKFLGFEKGQKYKTDYKVKAYYIIYRP